MEHFFQHFILRIGGLFRWIIFQFLNVLIEEKYSKELEYYMNHKDTTVDKNSFTTVQKNLLAGITIIIAFIFLIAKIG